VNKGFTLGLRQAEEAKAAEHAAAAPAARDKKEGEGSKD